MLLLILVLISFCKLVMGQFTVPDALVEVFQPRGLRVSIPDQEGIKLFAFHGQVNQEMNGREGGTFSRDVTKAKGGRWTFYDSNAQLKKGDILYYWTYVDYFDGKNKLGYTNDDNEFVVKQLLDKDVTSKLPVITERVETVTLPSGCKASLTTLNNQSVCSESIIFEDNFNSLRRSFWNDEIKFAQDPDYEFVIYTGKPQSLTTKNGHLQIRPRPSEDLFGKNFVTSAKEVDLGIGCTGVPGSLECTQKPEAFLILPPVASAQITTKKTFSFKYGKVEIRAKLPKGDWIYPELYLNPARNEYGPGYASGQIRIAFLPGNEHDNQNLQGGIILGSSRAGRNYGLKTFRKTEQTWTDDFHKFAVVWKPDEIVLSVDDRVYGNIYPPKEGFASESQKLDLEGADRWRAGSILAPFDKEMYLVIGVGAGGHSFDDRSDGTKPWKNNDPKSQKKFYDSTEWRNTWTNDSVLDVDYVKVWAL